MSQAQELTGVDAGHGGVISSDVPRSVLVVDDEPDIVEELVEQLEDEGFECIPAYDASSALSILRQREDVAVVVTDIRMPGMDGLEMARQIRALDGGNRDIYLVVVTGHAGMKEAIEALQLGAQDFLTKPISPEYLLHSIRRGEEMIALRHGNRSFNERLHREVESMTGKAMELAEDLSAKNRELEAKNRELEAADRLKSEFLSMISHELNTPLNAIIGFSELLQYSMVADDERKDWVEHIHEAGGRLHNNVKAILDLAEFMAGDSELVPETFAVTDVFDDLAGKLAKRLVRSDMRLETEIKGEAGSVVADRIRLTTTLGNLLDNAIKFSGKGAVIRLSAEVIGNEARFSIADQGSGMTKNEVSIALEPFRQVDGSIARKNEGMGLGLPLARAFAEIHGGQLQIESTPGKGTTVTLVLPQKERE
ncbi:MAG: hybrid sensor histidine kinase/response regulator [Rhodospirillales bacterium]|nr:hybrid sensor histidine kinase/response regulator [Rhodospirillales bacterium]